MGYMKNLDCNNQIKIFINLEIIGEEKLYIFFKSKNLKKNSNLVKSLAATTASKPNFNYINKKYFDNIIKLNNK